MALTTDQWSFLGRVAAAPIALAIVIFIKTVVLWLVRKFYPKAEFYLFSPISTVGERVDPLLKASLLRALQRLASIPARIYQLLAGRSPK